MKASIVNRRNLVLLPEFWLYGIVISGLVAISNVILFFIFQSSQMLFISAGSILCAGIFLISRFYLNRNQPNFSALLGSTAWAVIFILHSIFWSGIAVYLLIGVWFIPLIWFFGLPNGIRRFSIFFPTIVAIVVIAIIERYQFMPRVSISEFSINRYVLPIYFFIFGVLIFLISLRGLNIHILSARMIISMATIVFIPITILTMVAYSNTKMNDTLTAANTLHQIASRKADELMKWSSDLLVPLSDLVTQGDTNQLISRLLLAHDANDSRAVLAYRDSLEFILANIVARYGFEEINIIDPLGIVVTSTRVDLIDSDFQFNDFFWEGKTDIVLLPPRYYPPEDQISVFASLPILNTSNELIGVLSARASVDRMIELTITPATESYKTTLSYLLNADGTLLMSSQGRSNAIMDTYGAQTALSTRTDGSASYINIDGMSVLGVYHWLPELNVAVLVEASEAEIFQRLPGIIAGNLAIGLLGFFLAIIAAITIVRSITNPIDALVNASREVIAGNLNIQVVSEREDELGALTVAFNQMTSELNALVSELETRVADRTREVESRSLELQTAALIARDASLASDANELLDRTARLIYERFNFYHVGIFLNDEKNENAILCAAAGDAGQILLANNHKLKIGETGIVGSVSRSGEPRIALDVGADAVYFRNPMLPYTRSEMALPLKVGSKIVGVLDVQSDKVNAFDQNDITIMSILTDQLAIALERTRLFEESNKNNALLEMALGSQTSRAWREYLHRSQQIRGYRYDGIEVQAIPRVGDYETPENEFSKPLIIEDSSNQLGCSAIVPIRLRGSTIGKIKLQFSTTKVPTDTIRYLEEASDRLSLALENARLLQDAQRLANQEQQINRISSQIQQSTDIEIILQNTIRELGKTFGIPKTFIQVGFSQAEQISPDDNEA